MVFSADERTMYSAHNANKGLRRVILSPNQIVCGVFNCCHFRPTHTQFWLPFRPDP